MNRDSGTGNRTPSWSVRATDVSHYTMPDAGKAGRQYPYTKPDFRGLTPTSASVLSSSALARWLDFSNPNLRFENLLLSPGHLFGKAETGEGFVE